MKICITSKGKGLNAMIDPRFGRCQNFIVVDVESMEFEDHENPYIDSTGGSGIQSAQFVAEKEIKTVLTGNVGPNAFQTLQAAGVEVITGMSGSIADAVDKYKKGELKPIDKPSVDSHFGMK
ncbi:MAG: NifB/NifX family molybdenum-iron cluster-binding protein [Candidatus Aureabacteria bacterium]|nr:NifB/NifX family molybdenum-iron cluster-binding protein [Candidatus Auribacterota bacterium]